MNRAPKLKQTGQARGPAASVTPRSTPPARLPTARRIPEAKGLELFGHRYLPSLSPATFILVLLDFAWLGMGKRAVAEIQQEYEISIPKPLIELHRPHLQDHFLMGCSSAGHPIGDVSRSGVLFNSKLKTGMIYDYDDSDSDLIFTKWFECAQSSFPRAFIAQEWADAFRKQYKATDLSIGVWEKGALPEKVVKQVFQELFRKNARKWGWEDSFEEFWRQCYTRLNKAT